MSEQPLALPRWVGSNLVGVPATVLASVAFNACPQPLAIAGVRQAHPALFESLQNCASLAEAGVRFEDYLSRVFDLRKASPVEPVGPTAATPRRWRSSWRKLLQGWGMDANGPAGAVVKGWVESRFGLAPQYHKAVLAHFPSPAWVTYLEEKSAERYLNHQLYQQLDLLYEYCQSALCRFGPAGGTAAATHLTLWRGSTRCEEQLVAGRLQQRYCTVRLNNVVSFSLSRTEADCFGDWIFEVQVPACKVLVFPGLLPGQVLQGEQEVLAVGGDYEVVARYA